MLLPPSLQIAVGFLTRVPSSQASHDDTSFARSLAWFPLVGAGIGLLLVGLDFLLQTWLAPNLRAVLVVASWAWITGGLHLDGVADVFDAWSGGRGNRERTLEIMRDSRIGAHGAAALCLFLIAKVVAVAELSAQGRGTLVLAAPVVARFGMVALLLAYPYAREQGLGTLFRKHARMRDWLLGTPVLVAVLLACGTAAWLPAVACVAVAFALGHLVARRLGGLTGDVYGAAIEIGELACLVAANVQWR